MIDWIKAHLVPEARQWWRLRSTQLNAIGVAILGWVTFDPVGVLAVWNMMPSSLKAVVPHEAFQIIALVLFGLGMLARFVRQPKVQKNVADAAPE